MGVMSRTKTNRQPSMGDVAAAVGVSKTTISRYLHGNFGYMSDETKARIAQVIDELGYRPNRMAQSRPSRPSPPCRRPTRKKKNKIKAARRVL